MTKRVLSRRLWLLASASGLALSRRATGDDIGTRERRRLLADIRATAEIAHIHLSPRVLAAIAQVPRERFVPPQLRARAYANAPLEIGYGQTISQPFVVAAMTELADVKPGMKVLEVGTGSGYQAAVLAALGADVYTIEIIPELGRAAAARLAALGYAVHTRSGDGYLGWPEAAPFDGIIATAAPDHVPQPLQDQLKPEGRLVIPVGKADGRQDLLLIKKRRDGSLETHRTIPVGFVPLVRSR